jgi:Ca2+-binding RTX toxin-like protein
MMSSSRVTAMTLPRGRTATNVLFGDGGSDMLNGGAGDDQMHGGSGNDGFFGGGGNDTINGDAGNDTIYGDGGNDVIGDGTGDDVLIGGSGTDTFVFAYAAGSDSVADFHDKTDLLDFTGLATVASITDLDVVHISAKSISVNYFDGITDVTLDIVSSSPIILDSYDFLF